MVKLVKIEDKEYEIKEIKYKDLIGNSEISQEDTSGHAKHLMKLATGMTDEVYENLSMKDGLELQKAINKVNGLEDFQEPLK